MLSHVTLGVNDIEKSIVLYDAIMDTLGYDRRGRGDDWAGYGDVGGIGVDTLWILKPLNERPATAGNGTNVALVAGSRAAVDAFYNTALELAAVSEGAPGVREENHPNFYAAYIRDYDGNKLVAVCHNAEE